MAAAKIPGRGDIVRFYAETTLGTHAHCTALVLSPRHYNEKLHLALVAPIARNGSGHGFEVILEKTRTTGVALCHHIRTLDIDERSLKFLEVAPEKVTNLAVRKAALVLA